MTHRFCVIVKSLLGTLFNNIITLSLSMEKVLCYSLSFN